MRIPQAVVLKGRKVRNKEVQIIVHLYIGIPAEDKKEQCLAKEQDCDQINVPVIF